MLIGSRSGFIGNGLPYDREVEYLEKGNGSYINTGIYGNNVITVNCKWSYKDSGSRAIPFGSRTTSSDKAFSVTGYGAAANQNIYLNYGTVSNFLYYGGTDVYQYIWEIQIKPGNSWITKNGVIPTGQYDIGTNSSYSSNFQTVYPIILFGNYNNGTIISDLYGTRIWFFQVKNQEQIIQDLIPVRKGHVGYMYDKVSKRLFGNSGTGSFILGPDKAGGGNLLKLLIVAFYAEPSEEMEAA